MGRYFNPANEGAIKAAGGRRLNIADHGRLTGQLSPGESLGILLDRYAFTQVADVTSPSEFDEFWGQVEDETVSLLGFFAIPSSEFK